MRMRHWLLFASIFLLLVIPAAHARPNFTDINYEFDRIIERGPGQQPTFCAPPSISADAYDNLTQPVKYYPVVPQPIPNSRAATLFTIDALISAGNFPRAELFLTALQRQSPGPDVDQRLGFIYGKKNARKQAIEYYLHAAQEYELQAKSQANPRELLLLALDAYQNAGSYKDARRIMGPPPPIGTDFPVDIRWARQYMETGRYEKAIEIYDHYPGNSAMQLSKGWALAYLLRRNEARNVFQSILTKNPGHAGARASLNYVDSLMSTDLFLIATFMNYGNYQDKRFLFSEMLRYIDQKVVTTLSHTRTDISPLSTGKVDFNENLIALKCNYQFSQRYALQLHMLDFQNDDPLTDHSNVFGTRFFFFPTTHWTFDAEYDYSSYSKVYANQLSLNVGHVFTTMWRADLTGIFVSAGGSARKAATSSTDGAKLSIGYTPNRRWYFGVVTWLGQRLMAVDSDGLYGYNTLDVYNGGWSLLSTCRVTHFVKLYLSYNDNAFTSESLEAANAKLGYRLNSSSQRVRNISFGVDTFFW
ncbi:MAG: hypothetical protein HQM09_12335 [Candidatus Riflebacteria bacterium]|nr:hypothetical protein [Candidatus Riflebacteria bacterium]